MFNGDANSYANNSGNSYTYITNNISVADSFNQTHSDSHNGHGRGGVCGIVAILFLVGIPGALLWFIVSVLSEVFR
jgi:hypothetical protein